MTRKLTKLKTGIVCILDALGTKGAWNRDNPSDILEKWSALVASFVQLSDVKILDNVTFSSPPTVKAFSDTVIITYHGDHFEELMENMASHIMIPFCNAIDKGIFFRGAIAVGEYYESDSSLIGPAIDEAVAWYEKGNWFGVLLTPSASYLTDSFNPKIFAGNSSYLVPYDVPLNNDTKIKTWVLNWPYYLGVILDKNPKLTLLNSFSNSTIFEDSYNKYQNSYKFFEKYQKKKQ